MSKKICIFAKKMKNFLTFAILLFAIQQTFGGAFPNFDGNPNLSGTIRVPIIMVEFQNRKFTKTKEDFELLLNQPDYTENNLTGSLHDYFLANSYGQLDLQFDVFGPFTMPENISAYATHCQGGNAPLMARMAIDSAYLVGGADFSIYDPNNTGRVRAVHIIYAGFGTEAGAPPCSSIWAHANVISPVRVYNGKTISLYSCSPELRGNTGNNMTHIGVIAHELGHSLCGLPDFYNTANGNDRTDVRTWCLMASGSWNDNGRTPALISAYGRIASGWVPEKTLTDPADVNLPSPMFMDAVYRINTTTPNEYFLLENRQRTGWDAGVPGSGMLIFHVDRTSLTAWNNNGVNAASTRRRYYVKQAGCSNALSNCTSNRGTDPFPQNNNRNQFTDSTTPNARSWAGINTEKPITDIVHNSSARTISFKFMGGGNAPIWGISLNVSDDFTFPDVEVGYDVQTPLTVQISNSGNQSTGDLTITLSGADTNHFTISKKSVSNLIVGAENGFTIVPKIGLDTGTYTATVTVSGKGISKNFNVSFFVTPVVSAISEFENNAVLSVYPNPITNGQLTIDNGELPIDNVEIYDIMGKKQLSIINYQLSIIQIDISHLPNGMYIVKIGTYSVKIVKQ
jgi:M6 family metalloprotease-like protein